MASIKKRLTSNVPGDFFVDSTCINCDTCRQLAPEIFTDTGEFSSVAAQPKMPSQLREATQAMLACPTGSIGTTGKNLSREVIEDFPLQLDDEVFYCGFNSKKSFGGNSYLVVHPDGNWLIDSPRMVPHLVRRFEELGGIRHIFLTHRDDVADAELYAKKFDAQRIIHKGELDSQPGAEIVLDGTNPIALAPEFLVIPTIGHTSGHCVLLYRDRFLFSGDHLWWSRKRNGLYGSKDYCWYSWEEQIESFKLLEQYQFQWVLPGHGDRIHLSKEEVQKQLQLLIQRVNLP